MTMLPLIRDARRDAMLAMRMLARRPGFAAVALATLALGIGAPTAIFSVVNAVLIRPLPYPAPDRIVRFSIEAETPAGPATLDAMPVAEALEWAAEGRTLASMAVFNDRALTLTTADGPFRLAGISATPNLFAVLDTAPALGRAFQSADLDQRQIVLSATTWRRYFNADPGVVGTAITMDGERYRVAGVMADSFRFPTPDAAFWVPQVIDAGGSRGMALPVIARMRADATLSAVIAEGTAFLGDTGDPRRRQTLVARTFQDQMVGGVARVLWVLMAAVSLVSVIATVNIALLLLTRGAGREREFSIRLALGAGRGRLARQLFIEGMTLALLGGALGLALAAGGLRVLLRLAPANLPRLGDTSIDASVLLFALAITLAASVVFGLLSAGRLLAVDVLRRLAGPSAESRLVGGGLPRRQLNLLAAAEVALTMVLLVGAGLLLRSFVALVLVPQGFQPQGALAFSVSMPSARYAGAAARFEFINRLRVNAAQVAGVEAVGLAASMPSRQPTGRFAFAADPAEITGDPMTMPVYETRMVSDGFFEALGMPVTAGRAFTSADVSGSEPVIVISQRLADRQFHGRAAVGEILYSGSGDRRVVGVVPDVQPAAEGEEPKPAAYLPISQASEFLQWQSGMNVVVRSSSASTVAGLAGLAATMRALVLSLDANMPPANMRPLVDDVAGRIAGPRFSATVLAIFAAIALVMASLGVYGVMAYGASRRTREIGVRVALGATRAQVLRLMMRDGLLVVGAGLGVGVLGALWSARALAGLLHEVTPADPLAIISVGVLLTVAALLAVYVPARRATRISAVAAIREG